MRFFLLCIGFIMAVLGGISLVAYLNLLTVGFTIQEYSLFILQRIETYLFIIGTIMIFTIVFQSMKQKRSDKKRNKY